jgi:peptidoglycan hydrolase-like protein with peptidoglycan-binding domain
MKGEAVLALRRALRRHGQEIPEDDLFDAQTVAATKAFQMSAGLEADGVVGVATKKALGIV